MTDPHPVDESRLLARIEDLEKQVGTLRAHTRVDEFLNQLTGEGGLAALVQAATSLTRKSVALFDRRERIVCQAAPDFPTPVSMPSLREIVAACAPVNTQQHAPILVRAGAGSLLARRKLLTSVEAAGEHFGWLVIDEHPSRLTSLDGYVARRVADRLGAEFLVQRRLAAVAWNARSSLTRQLLRGTLDDEGLLASGEYLGVDLKTPRVVAFIAAEDPASLPDAAEQDLAAGLEQVLGCEVLSSRGPEGIALMVSVPKSAAAHLTRRIVPEIQAAIESCLQRLPAGPGVFIGTAGPVETHGLPRAYRVAREAAMSASRLPGTGTLASVDAADLGPARLFLAHADNSSLRGFVDEVLGQLKGQQRGSVDLLTTVRTYFDTGRSVRVTAQSLGVHENTVRLRLGRIHALTGFDVAGNAEDQLTVQIALMLDGLQRGGEVGLRPSPSPGVRVERGTA